jgi:hypothetical protein
VIVALILLINISGNGIYKADQNALIFSFINKLNHPLTIGWSNNNGIIYKSLNGALFGSGSDLSIADESNKNTNSCLNLCHSYIHPDYLYRSNEAKSFLAGSFNFRVSGIEIYTKQ